MEYSKIDSTDTFNLFEVGPFETSSKDKARKANERECKVYAQWLALKAGLLIASTKSPKLEWKQTGRTRSDRICIGAYYEDEFIAFPGADQTGAVELEILGDDGEPVSSTMLYKKATGTRSLTFLKDDIAAIRKAAKQSPPVPVISEPVESQDDAPAKIEASPVDIPAPVEPMVAIEAIEPERFTISGAIRATMPRGGAWDWSRGYQGNEYTPSEAIKHDDRPRRLRIVRAYLRMRKERAALRAQIELGMSQLENANEARKDAMRLAGYNERAAHANLQKRKRAVINAKRHWKMRLVAREQRKDAEKCEALERDCRRSIARTGRGLVGKARRERDIALTELAKIKANRADPSNPERASDLIKLRDERDQARGKLESVTNERDRLKAAIVANAETLDKMIDRAFAAEAKLRGAKEPRGYKIAAPAISFRLAA